MTDDLVKRLRGYCDRIEQLEAALREIAAASKIIAKGENMETALKVMLASHHKIARAALGEKTDD